MARVEDEKDKTCRTRMDIRGIYKTSVGNQKRSDRLQNVGARCHDSVKADLK
jgi:hypothetical protein